MGHPRFDLPPLAPPDVLAAWDDLADRVCHELTRAGLPARRGDRDEGGPLSAPGADVHVDRLADGGVHVDWATGDELRTAALELFAGGVDFADPPPLLRHHRTVHAHLRAALSGILASAGFEVAEPDPHTHGTAVHVKGPCP
ncbi:MULTISPECIES: hypothetical protein [Streptomyces]|uniref:hypothetical protein n=1 Tax=Streptomyces TaxID=1883 RepID=UPI00278C37AB|nr:hypothetical protein [Streptomyces hydrogenans]